MNCAGSSRVSGVASEPPIKGTSLFIQRRCRLGPVTNNSHPNKAKENESDLLFLKARTVPIPFIQQKKKSYEAF